MNPDDQHKRLRKVPAPDPSAAFERPLPHSPDAERAVLGAMLRDPAAIDEAIAILGTPNNGDYAAFFDENRQLLYSEIVRLNEYGKPMDGITIKEDMIRLGHFNKIGGYDFLADLIVSAPSALRVRYYAEIVAEKAHARKLIGTYHRSMERLFEGEPAGDVAATVALEQDASAAGGEERRCSWKDIPQTEPLLDETLIEGVLRRGGLMNVIAPPKTGKTFLVTGLAMALAHGRAWFGLPCYACRVLILDNELSQRELHWRAWAMTRALKIEPNEAIDFVSLRGLRRDINDIASMLRRQCYRNFGAIIIDSLYRTLPDGVSELDDAGMRSVYETLTSIATRSNAAIIVVHHTSKGDQSEKGVTDVGSGSGVIARAVDAHVVLRPHEAVGKGIFILEAAGRSFREPAKRCLKWEFPLWEAAADYNPARAKRPGRAAAVAPSDGEIAAFIGCAISNEPRNRKQIELACREREIARRQSRELTDYAVELKLIHRWPRQKMTECDRYCLLPEPAAPSLLPPEPPAGA